MLIAGIRKLIAKASQNISFLGFRARCSIMSMPGLCLSVHRKMPVFVS